MTRRAIGWWRYGVLAALAYLSVLTSSRGRVAADTKQYLYLDPGRLLDRASSLWDPNVHLGTVTHQNIGYLFPAGPYYWVLDRIGVPDWVAQRLWLGTILFLAGWGVLHLFRTLRIDTAGFRGIGAFVAAVVYMLSPYTLTYSARISVLLLSWAALPWMIALADRALREGGWRAPAAFALVVQLVGSVNATALLFVGLAPVLWLVYAVVIRDSSAGRAAATAARIGVLTLLASAWWIAGLSLQAGYGLNVLEYTETVEVVSQAGHAGEVLRGLGNWFFYGGDRYGAWIEASLDYTRTIGLILVGYAVPVVALVAAAMIRWRYRAYFVMLAFVGVVLAVGVHPYDDPSYFGAAMKEFSEGSSVGLALRSVGRATPLIALSLAVLLGVAMNLVVTKLAASERRRAWAVVPVVLVLLLAVVNLPALWNGTFYGKNLQRDEQLPDYWEAAIAALDERGYDTRILEIPGADFTSYRWGNTVEPITPGLSDRPYIARELLPYGSPASAQLLVAFDRRLQLGTLDAEALVPIARLLSAGNLVVRNDLSVDRFDLARPGEVMSLFNPEPTGLEASASYGDDLGPLVLPLLDERALALPAGEADPAPVIVYPVDGTRGLLRAESGPGIVLSGDADGVIDLAAIGLLDRDAAIRYSASLDDAGKARAALAANPVLVVTDTNRKRAQRWDSLRDTVGYTERAGEQALERDPSDKRLSPFTAVSDAARTVARQDGAHVAASGYGAPNVYLPADRPARAFDGDLTTAWRVGAYAPVLGERIRLDVDEPVRSGQVNLVQPLTGQNERFITQAVLRFTDQDGARVGDDVTVELGPESRTIFGQVVTLPAREFAGMEVEITGDNRGEQPWYPGDSPVGFAEIGVRDERTGRDVRVDEVVRLPRDLVDRPEAASLERPLVYVMTRQRNRVALPNISEEESSLTREFRVPADRDFGVVGQAHVSPLAPDEVVDRLLGIPDATQGGITVRSSDHLPTSVDARASSALDGSPSTAWTTDFGGQSGRYVEVDVPAPITFDRLDLSIVADGRHSVPTRLRIAAGGEERVVDVPEVEDGTEEDTVRTVPVQFPALTGNQIRVTVDDFRELTSVYSGIPRAAPIAIAELGLPGVRQSLSTGLSTACRDDLLTVDDVPVPVRVGGSSTPRGSLTVTACAEGAGSARQLDRGAHVLRTKPGHVTGLDIDRVVLASDAGGSAVVPDGEGVARLAAAAAGAPNPQVEVTDQGRTQWSATVRDVDGPFWLVLGESFNDGWHAKVDGRDLGPPELVDGFANGWRIDPGAASTVEVSLTWTPQRRVWIALALSIVTALACVVILVRARIRRRAVPVADPESVAPPQLGSMLVASGATRSLGAAIGAGGAVLVVGAVVAAPWVGLVAGIAAGLTVRYARARAFLAIGAPVALAVVGVYVAVQQSRYRYPTILDWPAFFDRVHELALLAIVLLLADAVVELVRTRRGAGDGPDNVADDEPTEVVQPVA